MLKLIIILYVYLASKFWTLYNLMKLVTVLSLVDYIYCLIYLYFILLKVVLCTLAFTAFELPPNGAIGTRILEFLFHSRSDLVRTSSHCLLLIVLLKYHIVLPVFISEVERQLVYSKVFYADFQFLYVIHFCSISMAC